MDLQKINFVSAVNITRHFRTPRWMSGDYLGRFSFEARPNYFLCGYRGFMAQVSIGAGAGYIGGRTAFLSWRSDSLNWRRTYRGDLAPFRANQGYFRVGRIEFGVTKNANLVPYMAA